MRTPEIEPLLLKLMSSIILFRDLEREDLVDLLRGANKASFRAKELVFEEDYAGHSMYIVVQGKFEVFKSVAGADAHIAFVMPGEHFGEIALVTDRPRMASVRAVEDSIALRLTKGSIFAHPRVAVYLLKNMACLMSSHLSEMNDEVLLLDVSRRLLGKKEATQAAAKSEKTTPRVIRVG